MGHPVVPFIRVTKLGKLKRTQFRYTLKQLLLEKRALRDSESTRTNYGGVGAARVT